MTDGRCRVDIFYATLNRSPTQDTSRVLAEAYVKGRQSKTEAKALTYDKGRYIFDRQSMIVDAAGTKGKPTVVCVKIILKGTLRNTTLGRGTIEIPETVGLGIAEELDLRDASGAVVGRVFVQISLSHQTGSILAVRKNTPTEVVMSPKTPLERVVTSDTLVSDTGVSMASSNEDRQSDHSSQSGATGRSVGSHVLVCGQVPKKSRYTKSVGQMAHQSSGVSVVSEPSVQPAHAVMPSVVGENKDDESYPLTSGMEPPRFGTKKKPTIDERFAKLKAHRSVPITPQNAVDERFPSCLARQPHSDQYST